MWWSFFPWSRSPLSGTLKATVGRAHRIAERIARRHCHEYVGTEHLLLALLLPPANPATSLLERCGVAPDEVTRTTEQIILGGPGPVPWGRLSQTPAAGRALEVARQEAAKATSLPAP
jgi:ATP-dependent Clp protease ATP-binding subunit ClpA